MLGSLLRFFCLLFRVTTVFSQTVSLAPFNIFSIVTEIAPSQFHRVKSYLLRVLQFVSQMVLHDSANFRLTVLALVRPVPCKIVDYPIFFSRSFWGNLDTSRYCTKKCPFLSRLHQRLGCFLFPSLVHSSPQIYFPFSFFFARNLTTLPPPFI